MITREPLTAACPVCGTVYWTAEGHPCRGPRSLLGLVRRWLAVREAEARRQIAVAAIFTAGVRHGMSRAGTS